MSSFEHSLHYCQAPLPRASETVSKIRYQNELEHLKMFRLPSTEFHLSSSNYQLQVHQVLGSYV